VGGLSGGQVLVIGASGFLGARLAERLVLQPVARVRALMRRVAVTRLSRLPVEVMIGDLLEAPSIAAAAQGCSVLFNCAKGTGANAVRRRAIEVDGARNVIEAARNVGARVVHVSSMAVYDLPASGDFDERTPDAPRGDPYADAKLEGERLVLELGARRGVPVVVIQPTVVYGPYAGVHGSEILQELRTSRVIMVDGGTGVCNAVYVDDVVTAMLLAATSDRAPGERFLVSGPEHPTWLDFFGAFEHMLGVRRTIAMSEAEALALWRRVRRRPWLLPEAYRAVREDRALWGRLVATREGQVIRRLVERTYPRVFAPGRSSEARASATSSDGELPISPLRPWLVRYLARKARARIDKARRFLGYEPVFRLENGMRQTEKWASWAGLL
jgi:nucleoside-diphosphate-sugar epimerase